MTWQDFLARTRAFLRWLATPLRMLVRGVMVLVNLTPRQMQSFCTLAMIGGIIANSFWIYLLIAGVRSEARAGMPFDSPFFEVSLDAVKWLAIMSGGFALFMCLIAFGAEWLRLRHGDTEFGTGRGAREAEE